jgi:glyoxylase-like metal-dependent hydrolase (beta-lactamase superfamily II)
MASEQVPVDRSALIENRESDDTHEVTKDVAYQRLVLVNVVYFGLPGSPDRQWVLIDTAIPGSAGSIKSSAESRFGKGSRPAAILMTHGHFDHGGSVETLAEEWNVPVYAHELEMPYLNGTASYPPPDPTVGGGVMALLAPLYPRGPFHVGSRLRKLPSDGSVPFMPGWRWIHVPGHTPGMVAFLRESDRTLIAADAFITTAQESAYAVMVQRPELHGPPMYYTQDWEKSRDSVQRLAALEPEIAVTGHGRAMHGEEMRRALHVLARDFDQVAVPKHGKYVGNPASIESGQAYTAPK